MNAHPSAEALERNDEQRARLHALVARLDEAALRQVIHDDWTVAAKLAHLAYWDRFALSILGRWGRGEDYVLDELPTFYNDCLNDALLVESLALPPSVAARLAEEAADTIDRRLRSLAPDARDRLLTDRDAEWLLRRHRHRAEHLDEIEGRLR